MKKTINPGTLYEGWEGSKAKTWHSEKELKTALQKEFKAAKIPASIRFGRGGYLTAMTVTIIISADEIKPFEAWKKGFNPYRYMWLSYVDESGNYKTVHRDTVCDGITADMLEKIALQTYREAVAMLPAATSPGTELLTPAAAARYEKAVSIVDEYNRDCSNAMIDYFDRRIYDNYRIKIS